MLALALTLTALLVTPRFTPQPPGVTYLLARPPVVLANSSGISDLGTKLDQEAGMSAYFKAADVITLSQVKPIFKTIEIETADYLIGSIGVSGYVEHYDTHVYVNHDGWILAYYLKVDPISKIIDINNDRISTTVLKNIVAYVAGTAGQAFSDVSYYDFRYPNATHMMLIGENSASGTDYTIQMPVEYAYFSIGWANDGYYNLAVDGVTQTPSWNNSTSSRYGTISLANFAPGVTHTCSFNGSSTPYSVLIILYRVP